MVATMDLAMAVVVAETFGVGAGVGPQARRNKATTRRVNALAI